MITLEGSDVDGDELIYVLTSNPLNGSAILNGNVVTYTPKTNWNGSENFTFMVSDGKLTSSVETVSVMVKSVNDAPMAIDQYVALSEDLSQEIVLAGSDIDGDELTYVLTSNPSRGSVILSGNVVTYTPNISWSGSDSFTFSVSDGIVESSAALVIIGRTTSNIQVVWLSLIHI